MKVWYFGCWNEGGGGHGLWLPGGRGVYDIKTRTADMPWPHADFDLDGAYAPRHARNGAMTFTAAYPRDTKERRAAHFLDEYPQGEFLRHMRNGCALIAWWDRTQGDTRGASNSVFVAADPTLTSAELVELFGVHFPSRAQRLERAGVQLREVRS